MNKKIKSKPEYLKHELFIEQILAPVNIDHKLQTS